MPLIIDLKPGEKIIINGAVIENAGSSTKLRVHNRANILRQREIMTAEDATTPASLVYFCLQCAYIFTEERAKYLVKLSEYLKQYIEACPSATEIASEIMADVDDGTYYRGLKAARALMKHEETVLENLHRLAQAAEAGQAPE
ncbi:MAG: flagellar biosynthesis repressor FlbT [Solirubrobacterales bacterium]